MHCTEVGGREKIVVNRKMHRLIAGKMSVLAVKIAKFLTVKT